MIALIFYQFYPNNFAFVVVASTCVFAFSKWLLDKENDENPRSDGSERDIFSWNR